MADSTVIPVLPNNLTIHGFGQDSNGELYAMVTNTAANGTGGIVYKLVQSCPNRRPRYWQSLRSRWPPARSDRGDSRL